MEQTLAQRWPDLMGKHSLELKREYDRIRALPNPTPEDLQRKNACSTLLFLRRRW